jgi:hypothetical protein
MDLNAQRLLFGAAGASSAEKLYIESVFSTYLYTGTGSTQTITNGIDLAGEGGMVWTKSRSTATNNWLYDTARGANNVLISNETLAQTNGYNAVSAFNSDGFTAGTSGSFNTTTYASWTFRKAEKFFDVVTAVAPASGTLQVSHGLGSTPGCVILKSTSDADNWVVYHRSVGVDGYLLLNSTTSTISSSGVFNGITDTYFTLDTTKNCTAGRSYVAYLFAHDAGGFGDAGTDSVVKCGSFTGTGSAGNFIDLGWEPQWVLIKASNKPAGVNVGWMLVDSMRGMAHITTNGRLFPNTFDAEDAGGSIAASPTGFTCTDSNLFCNNSTGTYIYIAIRRGPMKTPTDATTVFSANLATSNTTITTNFVTDSALFAQRASLSEFFWFDRLRGREFLNTNVAAQAGTYTAPTGVYWDSNTSYQENNVLNTKMGSNAASVYYGLRRAPGFFDAVCYTGTGSARTVSHNLGVAPELIITKTRSLSGSWGVDYVAPNLFGYLNLSNSFSSGTLWNNGVTSATIGTTYAGTIINQSSQTYIAYLFSTCAGVSKVGSYTGTGTTLSVDCGFASGARFVLIKRTDSTGDWYVWDSSRGIVSGNDPYKLLNTNDAEVTSTDYIDTLSTGFEITSTAPAAINASGGNFIFLAVA